jgi:hypothetical protein
MERLAPRAPLLIRPVPARRRRHRPRPRGQARRRPPAEPILAQPRRANVPAHPPTHAARTLLRLEHRSRPV